jgi:hypothetical protein
VVNSVHQHIRQLGAHNFLLVTIPNKSINITVYKPKVWTIVKIKKLARIVSKECILKTVQKFN